MRKDKRRRLRKVKRLKREHIRRAMNKKVFFTLTKCNKILQGVSNKYCYKSNMHNLIFKGAKFENVRYRASIITNCNFNNTNLNGVDFCNSNLRKTSFKDARLQNVCFINCDLRDVNFQNAEFKNVIFVCTDTGKTKNLPDNTNYRVYNTYPNIELKNDTQNKLIELSNEDLIYDPHVLHVNKNKLNLWTIKILTDLYGDDIFKAIYAIKGRKNKKGFFTIYSYTKHIESYLKL